MIRRRIQTVILCQTLLTTALAGTSSAAETKPKKPSKTSSKPKAPRLAIVENDVDLGTIGVGEEARHVFEIRNDGSAPLVLKDFKGGRGVTSPAGEISVPPGKKTTIAVSLDTEQGAGPTEVVVTFSTNDPDKPTSRLDMKVNVRAYFQARPGYARYNTVQGERPGVITQTLWSTDGATFKVLAVESPHPDLGVTFQEIVGEARKADTPGSQWKIETTLASFARVGPLTGDLLIRTDHPKQKALKLGVSGFVRPILAVTPPSAELGDVDPKVGKPFGLTLKNFATEKIRVTEIATDVPGIQVTARPVEEGRQYQILLKVGAETPKGPFSGTITIHTDSPKIPVHKLALSGKILGSEEAPGARPTP